VIVDELILKLQADLADVKKGLAQVKVDAEKTGKEAGANMGKAAGTSFGDVFKKGEVNAKKGGESLGHAAGKGFDTGLKDNVKKTLDDVKKESEGASSSLSGIFGKVGGAIAGAFALDKVVGFFKDSMKYASEMQEEMGGVSKEAREINEDFEKLSKNGLGFWNTVKLAVGTALNAIVTNLKALAVAFADAFSGKSVERTVELYHRERESLKSLGDEMTKLSSINKRTAEEELKLINLKEQLSDRAKKLGLDYEELARSGKSWLQILEETEKKSKLNAQADLTTPLLRSINRVDMLKAGIAQQQQILDQLKSNPGMASTTGANIAQLEKALLRSRRDLDNEEANVRRINAQIDNIDKPQKPEAGKTSGGGGGVEERGNEARFLDSALRLKTIQNDLEFTIRKAEQAFRKGKIDQAEFERIAGKNGVGGTAREEARQATEFELGSLRQGYAQFIEDNHAAKMEAIKAEADNARRLSNNLLEAELENAWGNEEELQELREANAKRLAEIDKAEVRKTATQYAQSFQQTMQAAQATTTGIAQLAKAKDIGSSLSAQGNVLQGISGFKDLAPSLGVLGPIGAGIGALGGIFSTIMGDSEAKAAERARQQAERDAAALKTLQSQEKYAKDLLEFQKAQANLPFKDLQRELRIIDIQTQQKRLSGTPGDQAELERLQRTSGAIGNVLQQQADKFTGGVFFNNSARSAEALSSALGDVDRYSPSMNLLSSIMSEVAATRGESAEKIGFDFYNTRLAKVASLDLPPQLKQAALDFISSVAAAGFYRNARDNGINSDTDAILADLGFRSSYGAYVYRLGKSYEGQLGGRAINTSTSSVDSMIGEFQADAGMIENLLGLFEKLNQTNLQIQDNTKKTADNTAKALELRPDRERSFIDVGLGFIQSLGQRISPSAIGIAQGIARQNLTLPTSIGTATATSSLARTLQERMADAMEIQVAQGERANQLLDGILRATIELYRVMDGNPGTVSTFDDAAATAYLADRKRRAY